MNRNLFLSASQCDERRKQNTDWQNDLIDEGMAALDMIRNQVGGDANAAADLARVARFLSYGPEPEMSPIITDEDVQWLFKQEGGASWEFKPDKPEEWR